MERKILKNYIQNNKILFSVYLVIRNYIIRFFNIKVSKLSREEKLTLKVLKRDGIVTIPNYFTSDQCNTMRNAFDKFVGNHSIYVPKENEYRIFGIERLSKEVDNIFSIDSFSRRICEAYLGEKMNLSATMSAKIVQKDGVVFGSGGSWHRDSFSREIKSISYLTDMTDDNGPFMYIKGSHKIFNIIKVLFKLKINTKGRYSSSDIQNITNILKKEVSYFPCTKGTLILADIRGLHTTKQVKKGFAYSIFNYYISKFDDNKFSNTTNLANKCISGNVNN